MEKSVEDFLKYLEEIKKKENDKFLKIMKWLSTYRWYLENEKKFMPEKLISYKRGDIIKANFGFNIGNELGGVHYAVVLDNQNSRKSGTLTVVPLSSHKKSGKDSKYVADLGNILQEKLDEKYNQLQVSIRKNINEIAEKNKKMELTLERLKIEMKIVIERESISDLKCCAIKNPAKYGYYAKDRNQFIIRPKDRKGLGSLPNKVYDTIYTKENKIFHEQAIGSLIMSKTNKWQYYKEDDTKVVFRVCKIGHIGIVDEITTMCTHFPSKTYIEIDSFEYGVAQGGLEGDLLLCIDKSKLTSIDTEGLKVYLQSIVTTFDVEVHYELQEHIVYELPILYDFELSNPSSVLNESKVLKIRKKEIEERIQNSIKEVEEIDNELNRINEVLRIETSVEQELKRMKLGSKALVSQITTISKLRVIDPKYSKNALFGISLDEKNSKKIDERIANLFFETLTNNVK